ncbi:MAG: hypothetical protein JW953_18845 [Anaerolineae bacterium]|nr:hypothetical protein [Anaerolineae bacterium]
MKEGLLWFDSDPRRKLDDKIGQAATRYQVRFGRRPTVCYLNVADLDGQPGEVKGIRLQAVSNVLRHHFWVGVENESAMAKAA